MPPLIKSAFERVGDGRYRVDFARLRSKGVGGLLRRLTGHTRDGTPDPFAIAQTVAGVMRRCTDQDAIGRPELWNEYKVFLSMSDHERLRTRERRLRAQLDTVVRKTLDQLRAATIGEPVIRILVDEGSDLPAGIGHVTANYVETAAIADPGDHEMTVRVPKRKGRMADRAPTESIADPAGEGHLRLTWGPHQASVAPLQKVQLGRPHAGAPERFVELKGADRKINRCQLSIENAVDAVVITRHSGTNPVQVDDRLIQRGGKLRVATLPVTVSLSSGSITLRLERIGES